MKIAIGIATSGRQETLARLFTYLSSLNVELPNIFVCSPPKEDPVKTSTSLKLHWLTSVFKGTCCQRNTLIDAAHDVDFLFFMDDDFLIRGDYLKNLDLFLRNCPARPAVITGTVISDGVTKGGLSFEQGICLLKNASYKEFPPSVSPAFNGYGCNMAVNMNLVRKHGIRFDESLAMYGWMEDVEFSLQMKRFGEISKLGDCIGVHLGSPEGRLAARRLGYSQVANPYYICQKHSLGRATFVRYFVFRTLKNFWYSFFYFNPIRYRRLQGNFLALIHLVTGKIDPRFVLDFQE